MIDRDKKFVNYARAILIGSGDDPLAEIINDPSMPRDLKTIDLLGSAVVLFTPPATGQESKKEIAVRGAFTPDGYLAVKKRLGQLEKAQDDDENSWILGKERKAKDARAIAKIKADYFVQYIAAWKRFLLTLSMREPTSLDEARALIKRLNAEKPFEATWKNISDNLLLKDESLADKALGMLQGRGGEEGPQGSARQEEADDDDEDNRDPGAKQVETAFEGLLRFGSVKPTGFEQYGQILTELARRHGRSGHARRQDLPDRHHAPSGPTCPNLIARYDDQGWEQGMLEKILMPPLRGAEVAVMGASADSANRKWCETVFVAFDQLLAGKYPFAGGRSSGEAKIADIEKFFQPDTGTLWQYFTDSLASDIERVGTLFRLKDGGAVHYREEFLKFLTHAAELTGSIFAKEPSKIGHAGWRSHPSVGAVFEDHLRPRNEEDHRAQLGGSLGRIRVARPSRQLSAVRQERRGRDHRAARRGRMGILLPARAGRESVEDRRLRLADLYGGGWPNQDHGRLQARQHPGDLPEVRRCPRTSPPAAVRAESRGDSHVRLLRCHE